MLFPNQPIHSNHFIFELKTALGSKRHGSWDQGVCANHRYLGIREPFVSFMTLVSNLLGPRLEAEEESVSPPESENYMSPTPQPRLFPMPICAPARLQSQLDHFIPSVHKPSGN